MMMTCAGFSSKDSLALICGAVFSFTRKNIHATPCEWRRNPLTSLVKMRPLMRPPYVKMQPLDAAPRIIYVVLGKPDTRERIRCKL